MFTPKYKLAHYGLHYFEEPCISGNNGSGTVFFSGCNMRCVYCQNYQISALGQGQVISEDDFINICRYLKEKGAHNINLVTPTHYVKCLQYTLPKIKEKLGIPLVYNTSGYENLENLKKLNGLVDIYLTDFRYFSPSLADKYSFAPDYFKKASLSLFEMLSQQPKNVYDKNGLLKKGVIVRILVLPSHKDEAKRIIDYLAEINKDLTISIMAQFFPTHLCKDYPEINRKLTRREYEDVCQYAFDKGFANGFVQELSSAKEEYVPEFNLCGDCVNNNPLHLGKTKV